MTRSFEQLVGAAGQRQRDSDAKRLGGLQVDVHLDFSGGLLDRQVGRFVALENPAGIIAGQARFGVTSWANWVTPVILPPDRLRLATRLPATPCDMGATSLRHAVPAVHANRPFAVAGGLLSYGADITDAYRCRRPAPSGWSFMS